MLLTCICIILNAKGGNFATYIVECAIFSTSIILKTISAIALHGKLLYDYSIALCFLIHMLKI